MADATLDARGLKCPLPVLKARKALKALPGGAELEVLATDRGAPADFAAFCRTTGNELAVTEVVGGVFRFVLRKTGR